MMFANIGIAHHLLAGLSQFAIVSRSSRIWAIVLGVIFALIAISLAIASWTKWGQSKPLTKCVALAVLAHVWLLMYAYGTRVIHPGNGAGSGAAGFDTQPEVTFQMLPAPTLPSAEANDETATPEQIVAPEWAKPIRVELPLEIPETLHIESKPGIHPAMASVDVEVPADLLEPSPTAEAIQREAIKPSDNVANNPAEDKPTTSIDASASLVSVANRSKNELLETKPKSNTTTRDIYQLRFSPTRLQIARQNGGDSSSEVAVAAALAYLASIQQSDGSWSAAASGAGRETLTLNENRHGTGGKADTAITGLALLAFMGDGHTHQTGKYQANVISGLEYLIASQLPSGDLSGPKQVGSQPDVKYARMYSHGISLLALAEAYAITQDTRLQPSVIRGANYTLQAQNPRTGGWRYFARQTDDPGDTSQFGWQAMAIQSCRRGGLQVDPQVISRMHSFLDSVSVGRHRGLAVYRPIPNQQPTPAMTAEAFASRALLGNGWDASAQREATAYLLQNLPGQGEENLYYYYYATLALFQQQGDAWLTWNAAMKPHLVSTQLQSGREAGSWDPNCIWAGYGGRVYSTAMAAMCLEVYYRYLPMYAAD
jgi:hypothetical protein